MPDLNRITRKAIGAAPCSVRKLAQEAGLSHALLVYIGKGERQVTPAVAEAIADALDRWSKQCAAAAALIRSTL
jgi:hypothetical protein